ncbi:MAG TPA: RNA 2',3'-cyclic phosphodiesterase [Bacteroidales bacterium]|nr:RNA 2',3'-cyclic phosphodiesterase [Bacteroidales bacterium]
MKRIFIALKIDPEVPLLKIISSLKSDLIIEKIKWTSIDNIHITLAFPGNTEEKDIEIIKAMLTEKCEGFGKFELIIKGAGVFKNLSDPRVIWVGIELSEKLFQLNNVIIKGLRDAGSNIEYRPFKPHLTIGRIKYINNKTALKTYTDKYQNTEIQRFQVKEVILYESILKQTGPVYNPICNFKL